MGHLRDLTTSSLIHETLNLFCNWPFNGFELSF